MTPYRIIPSHGTLGESAWTLVVQDSSDADWAIISTHSSEADAQAALMERERQDPGAAGSALHVFQSIKMPELYGFSVDPAGANLPFEDGPWEPTGDAIPLSTTMASTSPEIAEQVKCSGYALVKGRTSGKPLMSKRDSTP